MVREKQKEERRKEIVAAAEALIRETGSTDFSMGELAKRAGRSVSTIYNLMNSKSGVLYSLLVTSLDQLVENTSVSNKDLDPVSIAIRAMESTARAFTDDPKFLKPLYRYLLGVVDPTHRTAFTSRALRFWVTHLTPLETAGLLPEEIGIFEFSREFQIHFAGALDHWVQNELDDATFCAQIRYGGLLRLLALCSSKYDARLKSELSATFPIIRLNAVQLLTCAPERSSN